MIAKKIRIMSPSGLHLRPAGNLCNTASKYHSSIQLEHEGSSYDAKSVLSVLGACVKSGDVVTLLCEGEDEEEAFAALIAAVDCRVEE